MNEKDTLTIEEITSFIEEDKQSDLKERAKKGQDYYEGKHDILKYELYYYDENGQLQKDNTRSNIKIPHPFFTEIVDQQVQYMLSGKDAYIKSDNEAQQAILDENFNDNENFTSELQELLTDVASKGFGYMYAYIDEEGNFAFQNANPLGVVEVEAKYTESKKDYVIYHYVERVNKEKELVKRIQVWDSKQTYYYKQVGNGKIELDNDQAINPRPHIIYEDGETAELGFIPFFRLDNNKKRIGNLAPIKALIDDYDLMACGLSNNLQDASEYVIVVKGFEGDNVSQIQQNVKTKKAIGTSEGGDVDFKTVNIPYEARKIKLELDEKNIYRFGMAFNSAQIGDGNITNIVIKSRYALLDLKCNKLEIKLKQFLRKIIKVVLERVNKADNKGYLMKDVYFNFEREVMTNASDNATIEKTHAEIEQIKINTYKMLATVIDDETILKLICETLDIDFEDIKAKAPVKEDLNEFIKVDEVVNE